MILKEQTLLSQKRLEDILDNPLARREIRKTFKGFCFLYLAKYLELSPADFHKEWLDILGNPKNDMVAITAFRGSGKTTYGMLALPLWEILENHNPFILTFNETTDVAKLTIANLRFELESNELLIRDYGDMSEGVEKTRTWTSNNLLLANGSRILSRSRGQKVRGLVHRGERPRIVLIDDPESFNKIQSKKYRDDTEKWLRSEIVPAIAEFNSRLILFLNLLHRDSLASRLKGDNLFIYKEYPLLDDKGNITWKGQYPDMKAIERKKKKVTGGGSQAIWSREFLLKVINEDDQEVKSEWIRRYKDIPAKAIKSGVGVDLAISKSSTADYTAMTSGVLSMENGRPKIFVMPYPVNAKLSFLETIDEMRSIAMGLRIYAPPMFYIEDVAYQKAAIQEAERKLIPVKPMRPTGDKRARLRTIAAYIQNGTVLFPEKGAEDLVNQILGFGVEKNDDILDSFVYMILGLVEEGLEEEEIILL